MQLWCEYGRFSQCYSAQCQLLHWKEAAVHYKEVQRRILQSHYGEEQYVDEEE